VSFCTVFPLLKNRNSYVEDAEMQMFPIEKVQQCSAIWHKRRTHLSENKSEVRIILEHEFALFPNCKWAFGFLVGRKKKHAVCSPTSRLPATFNVSKVKIKWRILIKHITEIWTSNSYYTKYCKLTKLLLSILIV